MTNPRTVAASVCILNRDAVAMLRDCLNSLQDPTNSSLGIEIIVVDDASSDGSADMVEKEFPTVTLIRNIHNAGFASANNQAIRASAGDNIVLLNNDTVLQPGAIKALHDALSSDPAIAIAGGHLLNADGSTQLSYYKIDLPTPGSLVRELFLIDRWWPGNPWLRRSGAAAFNPQKFQTAGQVPGAFMAVRRDFLRQTGLLDERFYYWYEDVELCHRAWKTGWKVVYVPEAKVAHLGGATFDTVLLSRKSQWRYMSMTKYVALSFSPLQAAVTNAAIILSLLLRAPAFFVLGVLSGGRKKWFQAAGASLAILREILFRR
jgi:GT2 family glycosyltransferase